MHLLISSTAERPMSSAYSPGILFFLLIRLSSIGISCSSQILIALSMHCFTSALRSLFKKVINAFILWVQSSRDRPFCCNYFWVSQDSLRTSNQNCKKETRKNAESQPRFHALVLVYQYFHFDHKVCLMHPHINEILLKRFHTFIMCTPLCVSHSFYYIWHILKQYLPSVSRSRKKEINLFHNSKNVSETSDDPTA